MPDYSRGYIDIIMLADKYEWCIDNMMMHDDSKGYVNDIMMPKMSRGYIDYVMMPGDFLGILILWWYPVIPEDIIRLCIVSMHMYMLMCDDTHIRLHPYMTLRYDVILRMLVINLKN